MATSEPTLTDAVALQADACERLGSRQYAQLLRDLRDEIARGGPLADLLTVPGVRPHRDAVVLRLLGAVHRIVLRGGAPALAERYESAGGDGARIPVETFLATVDAHHAEVAESLGTQVQTNEIGRSAALVAGFAAIARHTDRPLVLRELGASAGLNLNWARYFYESGTSTAGDPASTVRFDDVWGTPADLSGLGDGVVVDARGCDMAPVDVTDPAGRLRLLSFVWPDQPARFRRLSLALDIALAHPPVVDEADAADWLVDRLAERPDDACTVVYHSIVWQYLDAAAKDRIRDTLASFGAHASSRAPLAWLRMEPAGPVAELRVTMWPGSSRHEPGAVGETDVVLGTAGYHGADIRVTGTL